ncbi:unnamed protein product [Parajaminaea phylloscopi]
MAGGEHHHLKHDPAIERWQEMHNTMYTRFRMTGPKTRAILLWGITVPVLAYYGAAYTDARWDWRAKRRGESLLAKPPQAAESADSE